MLLSVFVYKHKLTPGQWAGAGVVFAGISVEAWVKRRGEPNSPNGYCITVADLRVRRCLRKAGSSGEGKGKDQVFIDSPIALPISTV